MRKTNLLFLCGLVLWLGACENHSPKVVKEAAQAVTDSAVVKPLPIEEKKPPTVTFAFENADLQTVLDSMKAQANYQFEFIDKNVIKHANKLSISANQKPPQEIMTEIMTKEKHLEFKPFGDKFYYINVKGKTQTLTITGKEKVDTNLRVK